ncbi:MAG: aspartyl protease family protein [Gemmatimonadaceae bacterium]
MSDMGTFRTTLSIESPARRGAIRKLNDVLVDTGSELTWIPRSVLDELGIPAERRYRFVVADGRVLERDVGYAIVHVEGVATADDVVFAEPEDLILLGARSLEGLNLRIDPRSRRLVGAGPIVAAVA